MDKGLVEQIVAAAASVVASGAISANGHGNLSLRVPDALGGPVELPADLRAAALQRAMAFDASGTKTA